MDHDPRVKRDEQYPLLKVEASNGGGDTKPQQAPSVVTAGWTVNRTTKQSWLNRWPECMSVCWMTIIVFAVSILVFYSLGINYYRRQPVVVFKCNNSQPASDVYYHLVVQKGSYIPLTIYSEYLSSMAVQYPSLRFNVYFLIDDSSQNGRKLRLFKRLPAIPGTLNVIVEQSNRREIKDFQRRYQNVNITIMTICKFMAKTPLRYKWKSIPLIYVPFYARILSVWQTGGIGIDLVTFNNLYANRQLIGNNLQAIFKQHNDGIETEKYVDIFNSMEHEDNEIFSLFYNVINNLMNQTSNFFSTDVSSNIKSLDNVPLVRTHRNKREIVELPPLLINTSYASNITNVNSSFAEATPIILVDALNLTANESTENNASIVRPAETNTPGNRIMSIPFDFPPVMIFYDLFLSDDVGPSYPSPFAPINQPTPMKITEFNKSAKHGKMSNHLSVSFDGTFVAASMCYHPFLTQLLSTGCKRENPSIAIKDVFKSQCSTFLRNDVYCDNIHIINNIFD